MKFVYLKESLYMPAHIRVYYGYAGFDGRTYFVIYL